MTTNRKRGHGEGAITQRGQDRWRIRWRVNGKRFTATVKGSMGDARRELRAKLKAGDDGSHVAPDKITLSQWAKQWLDLLARNDRTVARRGLVNPRSLERYDEVLRLHVLPTLGDRPLQKITPSELDALYVNLEKSLAARTVNYLHIILRHCLGDAVRKGLLLVNPATLADAPVVGESDAATVLEQDQLTALVKGFQGNPLYPIVAVAAYTGARRNEILALRWTDFDAPNKRLTIARSLEETKLGDRFKEPKTKRGNRTITIDGGLVALLTAHREKHLRIVAGVPDDADVDLSLVKLPADALIFPSAYHGAIDLTKPRNGGSLSDLFGQKARKLGYAIRFHDLRATHETLLLDAGVPVHTVAARCGHDAAVLLRNYARRTQKGDTTAADVIGALSKGALGS